MPKFRPGQSGNPAGRPKGATKISVALRHAIADDLPRILATLRDRALDGDVQACSLLLSRCLPPLRPQSEPAPIDDAAGSLSERGNAVLEAALSGDISPSTGTEFMSMLSAQARIVETTEIAARLERIEATLKAQENSK